MSKIRNWLSPLIETLWPCASITLVPVIGMGSVILNNAKVGEGSIVAAGTVIPENKVIEPYSLVAGVPGKVKRQLTEDDQQAILMYANNYLDYTKIYKQETGR